jgi:hypothetical protein
MYAIANNSVQPINTNSNNIDWKIGWLDLFIIAMLAMYLAPSSSHSVGNCSQKTTVTHQTPIK